MKNHKIYFLFALLGILFCHHSTFGQTRFNLEGDFVPQYQIDSWNSNSNEFSNSVLSIIQSRDGHIWAGTFDGFYKFSGVDFSRIDADKKHEKAFSNYTFWSILEDSQGNIWLGTNGGGIILYDAKEKKYKQIHTQETQNDIVINLFEDSEGTIWAGTRRHLVKIRNQKPEVVHFENFPKLSTHQMIEDSKGVLWLATHDKGLIGIDKNGKIIEHYTTQNGLASNRVYSLLIDKGNKFWVATAKGLFILEEGSFKVQALHSIKTNSFPVVTRLLQDQDNRLVWVGTDEGLVHLKEGKQHFISGLPDNKINDLKQDNEGNIWVGTYQGGLVRLKKTKFLSYARKSGHNNNIVNSIIEDKQENIWIGTNDGLSVWKNNVIHNFGIEDGLLGKRIRDIFPSKNKIWIAAYGGVSYFENGKIHPFEANSELKDKRIRAIYYDEQKNELWIGSTQGLHCYTSKKEMLLYTDKELGNSSIMSINPTSKGLVIGTDGGGLALYKDGEFKRLTTDEGLGGNVVFDAYQDEQKNIWISTNGGLTLMQEDKLSVFRLSDGFSSNTTFQTMEDDQNKLWFTCNKSVFSIAKADLLNYAKNPDIRLKMAIFTTNDGLSSNITGASKGMKTKDGWFVFPTLKGISFINPSKIEINQNEPRVYIEKIALDGEIIEHIEDGLSLKILPEAHHINIFYAALSYSAPEKVVFKYRLYPFETEWIETKTREVSYTSLPSGKYTFELMAANGDGVWTKKAIKIKFKQEGYFYKNPLFWLVLSVLLGAITLLIYRYRLAQHKKAKEKLEHLVKERTIEIQNLGKEIEREARETTIAYAKVSDSIRYAKRIQDAIMQENEIFKQEFADFFIFWKAKDVVSGDFYWSVKMGNKIIIAVGDCTGHGVPGAFMTILGTSTLDKIVGKDKITDASLILQKLDEEIYMALHRKNSEYRSHLQEGMDISICVFDYSQKELTFAGAKSRAVYFQEDKMSVLNGDKSSIGSKRKIPISFNSQKIEFKTGDKLYLFSDGIPDQFGGRNNRKYLTSRLKKFLAVSRNMTMELQKQAFIKELADWQGDKSQIDDIILVGIEL